MTHSDATMLRERAYHAVLPGEPVEVDVSGNQDDSGAQDAQAMQEAGPEPDPETIRAATIPTTIDTAQPFPVGRTISRDYLGGLAWSKPFEKWIGRIIPVSVAEAARLRREWWDDPTLVAMLRRDLGSPIMDAILAYRTGAETYNAVSARLRKSPGWLARHERRAQSLVRSAYDAGYVPPRLAQPSSSIRYS